jgi:cyclomaltodextrinase / maltogenic alpha-amylase / neopullulanase
MENHYSNIDRVEEKKYSLREKDWRNGSIIYQVIVDRFAESENLAAKRPYYQFPRLLKSWSEIPSQGVFLPEYHVYSQEVEFWGGDLQSLRSKLDYLTQLEIDVLYLNPIHSAFTNHKYDASDYLEISPEYGTKKDFSDLIKDVHQRNIRILCDGVFNHMGRNSKIFKEACSDPGSAYRDWFTFSEKYSQGVKCWANAKNLPELNFENAAVRDFIYEGENSVIRSYLRLGIDGWRLDVAFELGYGYLEELTNSAHQEKPGSLIVGEIWNYPKDWFPAVDGVMNFTLRHIILGSVNGKIEPAFASDMIAKVVEDSGIEPMLKSWIVLDNHDTHRLRTAIPDLQAQKIAQLLQFTLPGSPNLYYGSELGMVGTEDPAMRAPMRWDLVAEDNEIYCWTKNLIQLRKKHRALKIGDYRKILSRKLIAFERYTDRIDDAIVVIVNPADIAVEENVLVPDSKLMNGTKLVDLLDRENVFFINASLIWIEIPAQSFLVLKPQTGMVDGYTPYKRVK